MLGLRKNITQGSFWFAITTLSIMGIIRCHSQAQRIQTLKELQGPKGFATRDKNEWHKYSRSKFRSFRKNQFEKNEIDQWIRNPKPNKPISNKLAFALLLELRKSQTDKSHLQLLQPQLSKIVAQQNPFPANIDINAIDSASLDDLPGIGPSTARKIVKFRERLGGFYVTSQLMEIPKIDTLLIETLSKRIKIDPSKLIELNTKVDFKQLYKHPYIGPSKAKIVGPFLQQHPNLSKEIWQKMQGITTEEKLKIAPYLKFID